MPREVNVSSKVFGADFGKRGDPQLIMDPVAWIPTTLVGVARTTHPAMNPTAASTATRALADIKFPLRSSWRSIAPTIVYQKYPFSCLDRLQIQAPKHWLGAHTNRGPTKRTRTRIPKQLIVSVSVDLTYTGVRDRTVQDGSRLQKQSVSARPDQDDLRHRIRDDGVGGLVQHPPPAQHLGLRHSRRVRGRLLLSTIDSPAGDVAGIGAARNRLFRF